MIKLLIIIPTLETGGAERQVLYLMQGLDRNKFDVHLCLLRKGGLFETKLPDHVSRFYLPNYKKLIRSTRIIKNYIREHKIELVHSFLGPANAFITALRFTPGPKPLLISSQRGIHYSYLNKWTLLSYVSHRAADWVIANSGATRDNCAHFLKIKKQKILVIPNGIEDTYFQINHTESHKLKERFNQGTPLILTVGRFDRLKGHQLILSAVQPLLKSGASFNLALVGDGPLKQELEQTFNGEGIRFFGKTLEVARFLGIADLFCLATYSEGLSNVLLEAMAGGVPVITTSIPANLEIIRHNETGILVPPGDVAALTEAIQWALNNPGDMAKMAANAKAYVQENFTVNRMVERFERIYQRVCRDGLGEES